jgi:hypothetical protein
VQQANADPVRGYHVAFGVAGVVGLAGAVCAFFVRATPR